MSVEVSENVIISSHVLDFRRRSQEESSHLHHMGVSHILYRYRTLPNQVISCFATHLQSNTDCFGIDQEYDQQRCFRLSDTPSRLLIHAGVTKTRNSSGLEKTFRRPELVEILGVGISLVNPSFHPNEEVWNNESTRKLPRGYGVSTFYMNPLTAVFVIEPQASRQAR